MMRAIAFVLLNFLYRLALFPWLTIQTFGFTMASQVNWLLTGATFEDAERRRKDNAEFKRHMSRN